MAEYTHPLLRFVNHRPSTNSAFCTLHKLAFVEKNRDAFFSKVTADDGTVLLDSFGNPYQQLRVSGVLGKDTTTSILVLEEYQDIQEDLEEYFQPDDVGNLADMDDPLLVPPAHKVYQIVARPRTGKTSLLHYILVHRLLQGLDTIYQRTPDMFTLWCSDGVFDVLIDSKFHRALASVLFSPTPPSRLPSTTWYLFEPSDDFPTPELVIARSYARIVQFSPPKSDYMRWMSEVEGSFYFYIMGQPTQRESKMINLPKETSDTDPHEGFYRVAPAPGNFFRAAGCIEREYSGRGY